jgi:hypothetical protein
MAACVKLTTVDLRYGLGRPVELASCVKFIEMTGGIQQTIPLTLSFVCWMYRNGLLWLAFAVVGDVDPG